MSSAVAPEVLGLLADCALEGSAFLLLGEGLARLARSPAQRHQLRSIALVGVGLLPLSELLAGSRQVLPFGGNALLALYGAGVLLVLLPLVRSAWALHRATADAVDAGDHRVSARVPVPVTWGLLRPVVLLPAESRGWSRGEREMALAHERAHIERGDWAVQLAVWLVCALLWFHPLVWWMRSLLLVDAERAADDLVLSKGAEPASYARHLLDRFAAVRLGPLATTSGRPSQLAARVHSIVDRRADRRPARLLFGVALAVSLFVYAGHFTGLSVLPDPPPPDCLVGDIGVSPY